MFFFCFVFCIFFVFYHTNFCSNPTIFHVTTFFYHKLCTTTNHYRNWGVNIYYHANFCSNPTIFQFYQQFYHTFLPHILPLILPQTTATNHYHNWRVNIYYHTNLCSNLTIIPFYHTFYHTCYTTNHYHYLHRPPTMFSVPKRNTYSHSDNFFNFYHTFLLHILPQILPQTTTSIAIHPPPQRFLYLSETHENVLRGLQRFLRGLRRFGDNLGGGGGGVGLTILVLAF